jgi:hypothetical protein
MWPFGVAGWIRVRPYEQKMAASGRVPGLVDVFLLIQKKKTV